MLDFIINETAGGKKAVKAKKIIQGILDEKKIPYTFHSTAYKKHATEIAKELCEKGATDIIAVGGDGTVNEVLNGITDLNVNMGIIPCGSGNDFADTAALPLDVEKALDIILHGQTKLTDFLVCDGVRGLNIIGTGIDVEILQRCEKRSILKGKLKYFVSLLISLIKFRFYHFTSKRGNEEPEKRCAMIVCAGNGKKFGGGIPMCPKAVIDDGKIDFIIVNEMRRLRIPIALVKLMKGKILEEAFCDFTTQTEVEAIFDKPIPIQIDGEIYDNLKFKIHIESSKLKLYRP